MSCVKCQYIYCVSIDPRLLPRCQTVECCGIMGVVSTEHSTSNDARHLLLEVCLGTAHILLDCIFMIMSVSSLDCFVNILYCASGISCCRAQGLSVLRNRGYDSAGMATATQDGIRISKYASRGELNELYMSDETRSMNFRMHFSVSIEAISPL